MRKFTVHVELEVTSNLLSLVIKQLIKGIINCLNAKGTINSKIVVLDISLNE